MKAFWKILMVLFVLWLIAAALYALPGENEHWRRVPAPWGGTMYQIHGGPLSPTPTPYW